MADDRHSHDLPAALARLAMASVREETVTSMLELVASLARSSVAHVDAASVAIVTAAGGAATSVASPGVQLVDRGQHEMDQGPSVETIREGRRRNVDLRSASHRWPAFAPAAAALGFQRVLAVPLRAGGRTIGALSLYTRGEPGFGEHEVESAETLARHAAVRIVDAVALEERQRTIEQLQDGLERRGLIGQAQGILMVRHACGAQEAIAMLRQRSQRSNRKVSAVAAEVVQEHEQGHAR